jgi:hypothetical protein
LGIGFATVWNLLAAARASLLIDSGVEGAKYKRAAASSRASVFLIEFS